MSRYIMMTENTRLRRREVLYLLAVITFTLCLASPVNAETDRYDTFNVVYFDKVPYVSLVDLGETYRVAVTYDPFRLSMTARRGQSYLTVTCHSPTAVLNGNPRNIILPARMLRGSVYAPMPTCISLFSELVPGDLAWDERRRAVRVEGVTTTIRKILSENYANGTMLSIVMSEHLEHTIELRDNNWLTIIFNNGSFEPESLFPDMKSDLILDKRCIQTEGKAEIAFLLSDDVGDFSTTPSGETNELLVSLRRAREASSLTFTPSLPDVYMAEPDSDLDVWRIDTVIIDPGHGGKDPGAVGPNNTNEKDIVLDIALELKQIIDKRGEVKGVLTRDKDVFVPLHRRAQIARDTGGKLFISIHANASRDRRAKGFEVYFLSAAKTKDAEEVARRENKAIELEENLEHYASFLHLANLPKDIRDIQIDMESSVYLKESQDMCRILLDRASDATRLDNRGVKQAGFLVMSGTQAFMPSILVEIGFISNADEEKLLKRASYQKRLAEAIYEAIILFKKRHERGLFSEG